MFKRLISFLSLFTSVSTLVCCALPALFVLLGLGATFAGLVGSIPQLIWISAHKEIFFGFGAVMLIVGGALQWNVRKIACPIDSIQAENCHVTRDWSVWVYFASLAFYAVGAAFSIGPEIFR